MCLRVNGPEGHGESRERKVGGGGRWEGEGWEKVPEEGRCKLPVFKQETTACPHTWLSVSNQVTSV